METPKCTAPEIFQKFEELRQNSGCQGAGMQQIPYFIYTNIRGKCINLVAWASWRPRFLYPCLSVGFITRRQIGFGGQRHAPAALPPGKRLGTHCTEGWLGFRAGQDGSAKSQRPRADRAARSELLYRLSCPAHHVYVYRHKNLKSGAKYTGVLISP